MGYEARGARCEVRVRGVLLPILLEQIISGGALEREQRESSARCALRCLAIAEPVVVGGGGNPIRRAAKCAPTPTSCWDAQRTRC